MQGIQAAGNRGDEAAGFQSTRARLPAKFTTERRAALVAAAASGATLGECADLGQISYETLNNWLKAADEHPELEAFAAEFRAARAKKHGRWRGGIERAGDGDGEKPGDWRAHAWLLERTSEHYRPSQQILGQLGVKHEVGDLSDRQIEHRIKQMIAHPTRKMRELLAQAFAEGNETLQEMMVEHVRAREAAAAIETSGVTVETTAPPELEPGPEQLDALEEPERDPKGRLAEMTVELEYRLGEWRRILKRYDRIALGGIPASGKGLFLLECEDRPVIHTDTWKDKAWEIVPQLANAECRRLTRYLLVGVRATGCIREGLDAEVLVWLGTPMEHPYPEKWESMAKANETKLRKLQEQMPELKVVRL